MALVPCRECGKEVSDTAPSCPHCGVLDPAGTGAQEPLRTVRVEEEKKIGCFGWGCLTFIAIMVIGAIAGGGETRSSGDPPAWARSDTTELPTPTEPALEVQSWSWGEDHGYARATGQVRNVSDRPLKNVEAVVSYYDASGTFIISDEALIEYNPILPGQASPFHSLTRHNPAMKSASLEFKDLLGGTIPSREKGHSGK